MTELIKQKKQVPERLYSNQKVSSIINSTGIRSAFEFFYGND